MKISILLTVVFCFIFSTSFAKIWRVNNNQGVNANFTTLQAAHDSASIGDTIHIEPSATAYTGITMRKKLVLIGPGYNLGENPNTQANKQSANVNGLTIYFDASGSVIMGLNFNQYAITVFANDIVIRRNQFNLPSGATLDYYTGNINLQYYNSSGNPPVQNVIISQNFGCQINIAYASTGVLINNNLIAANGYGGDNSTESCLSVQANAICIVQNNIFRRGKVTINNSSVINNIMYAGTFTGTGNLVSNNIGNATQFGTNDGNQSNVVMSTVFLGPGTGVSNDGQWKLAASSPAIASGYGSTVANPVDAGIYSGQTPYILSGIPPVPAVYFFENKPIGSNTDPITVTIKVKSNN